MKKLFLFAAAALLSLNLSALETYPLEIAGVEVTDENANDILNDGGLVSYDDATKTLTIDNVAFEGGIWYHPAYSDESELTIKIQGQCRISPEEDDPGIYSQAHNTHIIGVGENPDLTIETKNGLQAAAIFCKASGVYQNLDIQNVAIDAISVNWFTIVAAEVKVNNAVVNAMSGLPTYEAIPNYDDEAILKLTDCRIVYVVKNNPEGMVDGNIIMIAPEAEIEEFDGVLVAGKKINNFNAFDVLQNGMASVLWDNETKELIFVNTGVDTQILPENGVIGIEFSVPATIRFQDDAAASYINGGSGAYAVKTNSDLTITGRGSSSFFSTSLAAIALEPGDNDIQLTFDGAFVEALTSDQASIARIGEGTGKASVLIKGSKMNLNSNIENIDAFELQGSSFENEFYTFNDAEKTIWNDDMSIEAPTPIYILPETYPIWITGIQIDAFNKDDVLDDGTIKYLPDQHKLILDGTHLEADPSLFEINNIDLTVVCKGTVNLLSNFGRIFLIDNEEDTGLWIEAGDEVTMATNASDYPVIDVKDNILELGGNGFFQIQQLAGDADVPVIKGGSTYGGVFINAPLYISNSNSSATHNAIESSNIVINEHLVLDDPSETLAIQEKKGVVWKDSEKTDPILEFSLIIKPLPINFRVAGVQVTDLNADNILGDGGRVKFDRVNKLILTDAFIAPEDGVYGIFIDGGADELIIELNGENYIYTTDAFALQSFVKLTIVGGEGEGNILRIHEDANDNQIAGIFAENNLEILNKAIVDVEISNCPVDGQALYCQGSEGILSIDDADLRAAIDYEDGIAINCQQLFMGEGVDFRTNEDWPEIIEWSASDMAFIGVGGALLNRIWIGKNETFTGCENIVAPAEQAVKVLRDGQLLIIREGKVYNVQGIALE